MDTKLATRQIRLAEWANVIHDRTDSGLTVDVYCEQHGLSRDAYYYWLRKVKLAALQQTGFVGLSQPAEWETIPTNQEDPAQLTVRIRDAELTISSNTPTELIARVVTVIRSAE